MSEDAIYRLRHAIAHLGDIATDALLMGPRYINLTAALIEIQNLAIEYLDSNQKKEQE